MPGDEGQLDSVYLAITSIVVCAALWKCMQGEAALFVPIYIVLTSFAISAVLWAFIAWWLLVDFLSQHILVTIAITTVGPTTILSNLITFAQLIFIETGPVFWDLLHWGLE